MIDKATFRRSREWKSFRETIRNQQENDPITGSKLSKTFNLHHLDLDSRHYEDISDSSHFIGLNKMSHDFIHFLWRTKNGWRHALSALESILESMERINNRKGEGK